VYPENNTEVMPKLYLGLEQTMETNLVYASAGCPENVDNPKQIRLYICKDLHTSNRISFRQETPNWVTPIYDNDKEERLFIPRVAVESG